MNLADKVALITGAASGIGAATAERLAGLGATVVGADVADEKGEAVFAELGSPHRYRHLDVTDTAAWAALTKELTSDFGGIDVVHLNAGVMLRPPELPGLDDPLPWLDADRYRRVMSINTDGVFLGLMAALPALEARGGGDIVVTASIAGLTPLPFDPVYAMSKHALVGLVVSLGPVLESHGVRLNGICPGGVDTGIVPADIKAMGAGMLSPPSFIAGVVEQVLESKASGRIWVAMSAPDNVWQYAPPALEPPA
jgi:NAD(P)-dependent dehydrogenase (short-subunit alcohol dehydrogenase family)